METFTICWATVATHGDLWVQSHRLRHQAFIARLAYDVPSADGLEYDQFDTPSARYIVVAHQGCCVGVCRLVPSLSPYMLETVFPQLLPYDPPKRPDVWEASRITIDAMLPAAEREAALKALIVGVQQFGLDHGVKHFLGLMPVPIFKRTLMRNGVAVNILTERAQAIDGVTTAAGEILVDRATIERLVPTLTMAAAA
ncbi:acyl-homoserine-lactone synthase [Azospirillum argentinense]